MAFSFGFSGDDIDTSADQDITPEGNVGLAGGNINSSDSVQVPVQVHDLKEWVGEPFPCNESSFLQSFLNPFKSHRCFATEPLCKFYLDL